MRSCTCPYMRRTDRVTVLRHSVLLLAVMATLLANGYRQLLQITGYGHLHVRECSCVAVDHCMKCRLTNCPWREPAEIRGKPSIT
eukprot:1587660-Amphidinium_carterae.1